MGERREGEGEGGLIITAPRRFSSALRARGGKKESATYSDAQKKGKRSASITAKRLRVVWLPPCGKEKQRLFLTNALKKRGERSNHPAYIWKGSSCMLFNREGTFLLRFGGKEKKVITFSLQRLGAPEKEKNQKMTPWPISSVVWAGKGSGRLFPHLSGEEVKRFEGRRRRGYLLSQRKRERGGALSSFQEKRLPSRARKEGRRLT